MSDATDESQLRREAVKYMENELGQSSSYYFVNSELFKIETLDQIPEEWRKSIPWGDDTLTKGKGTNCVDILEKQLILKLSGLE